MGEVVRKHFKTLSAKDFRRIHWRKYLTRKVIILSLFGMLLPYPHRRIDCCGLLHKDLHRR